MENEKRIENLEIKLTYLEDFVKQLQEVSVEQSHDIEKLKKENKMLIERIKEMMEDLGEEIPNRKPPHY